METHESLHQTKASVLFRPYREGDDLAAISKVYADTWRAAYAGLVDPAYLSSIRDDDWVLRLKNDLDRTWLAVRQDGQPVGVVRYGKPREDDRCGWGEVYSLYVLPSCAGQGIGTQLLSRAVSALSSLGFSRIYLWVLEENRPARKFYESLGWRATGEQNPLQLGTTQTCELRYEFKGKMGFPSGK